MSDACIRKLKTEWDKAVAQKDWHRLGTCLRNLVNVVRSDEGLLKKHSRELSERILYLEGALEGIDFKDAMQLIRDIRHARATVRVDQGEFGGAFRQKLSSKDRKAIRKRTRVPALKPRDQRDTAPDPGNHSALDDFLVGGLDYGRSDTDPGDNYSGF